MDKRTLTLRAVVPEYLYEYAQQESDRQGRTVSTYLMRLVERDMRANDDYRPRSTQRQDRTTVDILGQLDEPRRPARRMSLNSCDRMTGTK